jgi:hypothetical protein
MLKNVDFSLVLLAVYSIRPIIFGASLGDAVILTSLATLYGYGQWLIHKKPVDINDSVKQDLEQLKSAVNGLKVAKAVGRF